MRPIATDGVTWSLGLSVGLSVTTVSHEKAAEPIVMPLGILTRVSPRNHVGFIRWGSRSSHHAKGNFKGWRRDFPRMLSTSVLTGRPQKQWMSH